MVRSMSSQRVVVGVSGVSENWQTLSWAVTEAGEAGKLLVVCHACSADSALAAPGAGVRMPFLELVEPALARAVAAARQRLGGDRVTFVARAEAPGEMLVGLAEASDLLVVGAPARPGWSERGSTTHHVARNARCSVVVVPRSSVTRDDGPVGPFRGHVVVGIDGSASAQAALQFGFGSAAEHRRPLVAVNVTPRAETDVWYDDELLEHISPSSRRRWNSSPSRSNRGSTSIPMSRSSGPSSWVGRWRASCARRTGRLCSPSAIRTMAGQTDARLGQPRTGRPSSLSRRVGVRRQPWREARP